MSKDLTHKLNGSHDEKLDRIITAVEGLDTRLLSVEAGLHSLEAKVEKRLKETRPMWEAVQVQLTELRGELKADMGELRSEFKAELEKVRGETEKGFRRLGHKIDLHVHMVEELHADLRDHQERLDKLEKIES